MPEKGNMYHISIDAKIGEKNWGGGKWHHGVC